MHAGNIRAVQPNLASGFDDSFRRHLAVEQRRAVLDTIARELTPDTTLGDIVDAAQDLGWADNLGELSLADLALALLGTTTSTTTSAPTTSATAPGRTTPGRTTPGRSAPPQPVARDQNIDSDIDDIDDIDDSDDSDIDDSDAEHKAPPPAHRGRTATATRLRVPKQSSLDRALERIDEALAARGRKTRNEPRGTGKRGAGKLSASKTAAKTGQAKKLVKKLAKKAPPPVKKAPVLAAADPLDDDDDTEAMSLDQAARLLVPLVRKLKEATMQDLEEQTHMGRRKLRFHIGQLVKHGKLRRHGMGRGTCYTVK